MNELSTIRALRLCDSCFLANVVRQNMELLNLSQGAIARLLNLNRPHLTEFLNGKLRLNESDIFRIISFLKIDPKIFRQRAKKEVPVLSAPIGSF